MTTLPSRPGIYEIVHADSGKRYIGSSVNIANRIATHKSNLRKNTHFCPHLQNAWNKHGEKAFTFRAVEQCLDDPIILLAREQVWIDKNIKRLYNSRKLSEQFSQEWYRTKESIPTRQKAAARMKEYRANLKRELVCEQCKENFVTNAPASNVRFCSAKCRARFRHLTKAYTVDMECKQCGIAYKGYAHKNKGFCSRKCSVDSNRMFSHDQVIDILTRIVNGDTVSNLASEFETTTRVVGKIVGRVTYSEFELPEWLDEKVKARSLKNRLKRYGFQSSPKSSSAEA